MANVFGTNNGEIIDGLNGVTNGADTIFGLDGNDFIFGLGGNDTIKGGGGADAIFGGSGSDTADYSDSNAGVFVSLLSGQGFGGTAEGDTLNSIENLSGSAHADTLVGNDGANTLSGGGDNDSLKGGGGADTLNGETGNDTLKGGGGADTLNGGTGTDTATYADSSAGVIVSLVSNTGSGGDAEGDTLNSIENLTGSDHNDTLIGNNGVNVLSGNDGNDTLKGGGGADTLNGGDGNDTLVGGTGVDTMNGGNGDDTYFVDNLGDVVNDTGLGMIDTVIASSSYTLGANANVEVLKTNNDAGLADISLTGNASSQEITGNAGGNYLEGAGGTDVLTGLGGQDFFAFTVLDGNVDTITDMTVGQDLIGLENSVFTQIWASTGDPLLAEEFVIGAAALDGNDHIIYNSATGALMYDADGNGAGAAVQFAQLDAGLALTNNSFFIM